MLINYLGFSKAQMIKRIKLLPKEINLAIRVNENIFGRKPEKFNIIICDNEEEYKKASKYYYFPGSRGTVLLDRTMVIKSRKFLRMPRKEYQKLINHEINHVFWYSFYKNSKPVWIHEGLACLAGNPLTKPKLIKSKISGKILYYRYLSKDFSKEDIKDYYFVWQEFLKFISKQEYGIIIKFLDKYSKNPTKSNYRNLFIKYFGNSIRKRFQQFIHEDESKIKI